MTNIHLPMDGPYRVRDIPGNEMEDTSPRVGSPLEQSLLHLDKVIANLDEAVEVLYSRTQNIRFDPPMDDSAKTMSQDHEVHSAIVMNINDKVNRISVLNGKIQNLTSQLEV